MKPRAKAFADELIANPKISQAEAYIRTHETTNKKAARVMASRLANQPNVMEYMQSKAPAAEKVIVQVMKNAKKNKDNVQWQRLAHDSAQSILDRTHGKPLTKTSNVNVNISIEEALNNLT